MSIVTKEVQVAKELDDVLVLVKEVVRTVKEKGDYSSLMDELVAAVAGSTEIPAEAENKLAAFNTVALRAGEIADLFIAKDAA